MDLSQWVVRILKKTRVLPYMRFNLRAVINGSRFVIPLVESIGYSNFFLKEPWMYSLVRSLQSFKKGIFIDVGANLGQTLLVVRSVSRELKYIGFEPNPTCAYYLGELIRVNKFVDVRIVPAAIYNFDGALSLSVSPGDKADSCATLLHDFNGASDREQIVTKAVSARSLNFLLDEEIAIIKIDVEGTELEVIKELYGCITRFRPFIICEILPAYSIENLIRIERQTKVEELLKMSNYQMAIIDTKINVVDSIPIHSDIDRCNYLFFPSETIGLISLLMTQ